ncbi:hypothetical protein A1351_14015 [Methylosinus sp. R-45379]|uniref:hypothetical protein n=1 Tax=Methylosinus sp. R-45379 TaxID=980563 RepID=UPI0007C8B106|nr:hypothetical protein [Methylosinus sp. R-45379]OAI26954.1 hypothetical protein A1351_14015 [Methylosinus sp. R-45379]
MTAALTIKAANRAPRVVEAVEGGALALGSTDSIVVIHAVEALGAFTVTLPPATGLVPGKEIRIGFAVAVAALTMNAGDLNTFLITPPSTVSANTALRYVLDASNRWCAV